MREEILKRFFLGDVTASELAKDIAGSTKRLSSVAFRVNIEDMEEEFSITRNMLISLCDAVLSGLLPTDALSTIGFALEASDRFAWDGDEDDVLANVIADWSCPEVNYPLTLENIGRFRAWLTGIEPYPAKPSETTLSNGRVVSIREKKSIDRFWGRHGKK